MPPCTWSAFQNALVHQFLNIQQESAAQLSVVVRELLHNANKNKQSKQLERDKTKTTKKEAKNAQMWMALFC